MKKICVVAFVLATALAGCSKKKADTTPTNPTTNATETTTDGNATGGSTYGAAPANPCAGGTTDPCAGQ